MRADASQLGAQSIGTLASIIALRMSDQDWDPGVTLDQRSFLRSALERALRDARIDEEDFTQRVNRKRAKYQRRPKPSEDTEGDPPNDSLESGEHPSGEQE